MGVAAICGGDVGFADGGRGVATPSGGVGGEKTIFTGIRGLRQTAHKIARPCAL